MTTVDEDAAYVRGSRSLSPGREPALLLVAVLGPAASLLLSFWSGLDPTIESALNALAVAAAGVLTGLWIRSDRLAPAIMGFAQALLVVALAFGWELTPEQQTGWITIVSIGVAGYLRTQITAPITNMTTTEDVGRHVRRRYDDDDGTALR